MPELCVYCDEKQCILPAWESFSTRLDDPKMYYLFYENFYKAALGETVWKEDMKADNNEARIGNTNTEAFAHLVLQNNYFSWLYEIKQSRDLKHLLTEYDSASKVKDKKHLVDVVLENIELDPP